MKEYQIKTSDNTVVIGNDHIIQDSISINRSVNSTGQFKLGVNEEKTIFKCVLLNVPNIRGKKISVDVTEDGVTHHLGNFVVNEYTTKEYGNPTASITAYSEARNINSRDYILGRFKRFLELVTPYYQKLESVRKIYLSDDMFYQTMYDIANPQYEWVSTDDFSPYLAETLTATTLYHKIYFYGQNGVKNPGIYKEKTLDNYQFSLDFTASMERFGDYGKPANADAYMYQMSYQMGASDNIQLTIPYVVNLIRNADGTLDLNKTPKLMNLITGWKIETYDRSHDTLIYTLDRRSGSTYSSSVNFKKLIDPSTPFVLDLKNVDPKNLADFFKKKASGVEDTGKTLVPSGERFKFVDVNAKYLTPSANLTPSATLTPSGTKVTRTSNVQKIEKSPLTPFGIIKMTYSDSEGGSHSITRRIRKSSGDYRFDYVECTKSYSEGVTRYVLPDHDSTAIKISNFSAAYKIYVYSMDSVGNIGNKKLVYDSDVRQDVQSFREFVAEDDSFSSVRIIEIEALGETRADIYIRDNDNYIDTTYSPDDDVLTYNLSNDFLSGGGFDDYEAQKILDRVENSLRGLSYSKTKATILTDFDVNVGDMLEVHTPNEAVVTYINSKTTKGGQLLMDDIQ